jgi:hypothetical protein
MAAERSEADKPAKAHKTINYTKYLIIKLSLKKKPLKKEK